MFKSAKNFIKCLTTSKQEKINYLKKRIYDYYFTVYQTMLYKQEENEVNVPDFMLHNTVKKLTATRTKLELERVIHECRVNKCFANAIKG